MALTFSRFLSTFLFFFVLLFFFGITSFADNSENMDILTHYSYPITPDDDEWQQMTSFSERLSSCRISTSILQRLTDDALLNAVLDFPFLINLFAYENLDIGYKNLLLQSDALRTLMSRNSGLNTLVTKFVELCQNDSASDNVSYYKLCLAAILSRNEVYEQLGTNLQNTFLTVLYFYCCNVCPSLFSNYDSILSRFVVYTPRNTPVTAFDTWYDDELDYETIQLFDSRYSAAYPNAIQLRSASVYYNCHSYAWYSQSTGIRVWINDPSAYMTDGSYNLESSPNQGYKVYVQNGGNEYGYDPVYGTMYVIGNHSAIVYAVNGNSITVDSKWGTAGLYRHNLYDSPYSADYTVYSYWSLDQ